MPPPPAIWNPDAILPPSTRIRPFNATTTSVRNKKEPNSEQEAARMAALKRLRHKLLTLCGTNTKPPTLAMERWISRAALARDINDDDKNTSMDDPILPSSGLADPGLSKDLSRSMGYEQAQKVAETMAVDAKAAADRISKLTNNGRKIISSEHWRKAKEDLKTCTKLVRKTSKSVQKFIGSRLVVAADEQVEDEVDGTNATEGGAPSLQTSMAALQQATTALETCREKIQRMTNVEQDNGNILLDTSRRSGIVDVMLLQEDGCTPKKPYHTISIPHLIKAVQLWQFHHENSQNGSAAAAAAATIKTITAKAIYQNTTAAIASLGNDFLKHLYCCLARYETIKGAGYQCAVPPAAFDAAHEELGLGMTIECFASPFNCRYRQYCSAFPDVEESFGSLGSFFDDSSFFPSHGSFEANPPFVPETMYAMNAKLERMLKHPKATALSFLVIVPVWGTSGTGYAQELEDSTYCIAKTRVLAADHSFCDGSQHKAMKQELRPSSWDTGVYLLQNRAGATEWPVTEEQLKHVFGSALKQSKTKVSLHDWERRGVGQGGASNRKRPHATTSKSSNEYAGKRSKF